MNKTLLPIFLLAVAGIALFGYTSYQEQEQQLKSGDGDWVAYLLKNQGENQQVLARTGQQAGRFGETTRIQPENDNEGDHQAYLKLAMTGRTGVFRFVMAGDEGEALALTAYEGQSEVYVHSNLIEDKLLKWWEVVELGDDLVLLKNISGKLDAKYLCGNKISIHSSDPSCKWKLEETELPF